MKEPRTEAGRRLLDGLADALGTTSDSAMGVHGELFRERVVDAVKRGVLAIEAEAVADLVKAVEGLPTWDKRSVPGGFHINRAAVLRLIRGEAGQHEAGGAA